MSKPFWDHWATTEEEIAQKIKEIKLTKLKKKYEETISFRVKNETYYLKPDDIYFIEIEEKSKNATRVGLLSEVLIVNKSIAKWIEALPKQFIQIRRQTIINVIHLSKYDHKKTLCF
ncbi:MAG: LytTR family transcriptional regulator [Saprospiraceae bacterium]|nr:LytTR family transcriptional regulator [Saprospiraceae bacterium]